MDESWITPAPPLVAGRYRLEERLGSGVSADVWRARDVQLDRTVALKRLHPHLLPDRAARGRFEAEARAAARLAHPGIVAVHDVLKDESAPTIVLEYVSGGSLADRIARQGPLHEAEAARIAAEVAEALAHAHAQGVVHRDVKPGNVLLGRDGRARLVDFGIARPLREAQGRLTLPGEIMGTLRYMAPEQLADEAPGPSIDIFALGAVLWEMLTGRPPFEARTPLALLRAQTAPLSPPPGVSPGLASICLACLRPDPADRPATAAELANDLRGWLAGARPERLSVGEQRTVAVARPQLRPAPIGVASETLESASHSRYGAVVAMGVLGVAAAAALVAAVLSAPGRDRPAGIGARTAPPSPIPSVSGAPSISSQSGGGPVAVATPTIGPSASTSATDPPSPPPPSTATPLPPPTELMIVEPVEGFQLETAETEVHGLAPPGARVVRDVPFDLDQNAFADASGRWSMTVPLTEGRNDLTFRIANDRSTERRLTVFYAPP